MYTLWVYSAIADEWFITFTHRDLATVQAARCEFDDVATEIHGW